MVACCGQEKKKKTPEKHMTQNMSQKNPQDSAAQFVFKK